MNITISLKEYVDLHDDEFFKRFMYNYSLLESLSKNDDIDSTHFPFIFIQFFKQFINF